MDMGCVVWAFGKYLKLYLGFGNGLTHRKVLDIALVCVAGLFRGLFFFWTQLDIYLGLTVFMWAIDMDLANGNGLDMYLLSLDMGVCVGYSGNVGCQDMQQIILTNSRSLGMLEWAWNALEMATMINFLYLQSLEMHWKWKFSLSGHGIIV